MKKLLSIFALLAITGIPASADPINDCLNKRTISVCSDATDYYIKMSPNGPPQNERDCRLLVSLATTTAMEGFLGNGTPYFIQARKFYTIVANRNDVCPSWAYKAGVSRDKLDETTDGHDQ